MQRWIAVLIFVAIALSIAAGFLIEPTNSRANLGPSTWRATYFANPLLLGEPAISRYERNLSYNWSEDAPIGVPPDHFSARWVGEFKFEPGWWRFIAGADDGVRVWVDDRLVIDQWGSSGQYFTYSADIEFVETNQHTIQVEYFDNEGLAGVDIRWEYVGPVTTIPDGQPGGVSTAVPLNTPQWPLPISLTTGHVASGQLDIHEGPGIQYARIGQVYLYQKFPVLGKNSDGSWYLLDLRDGRTGWVNGQFIFRTGDTEIPVISETDASSYVEASGVTLTDLSLRNGPSYRHQIMLTIPANETILVRGRSSNSLWYFIRYMETEGWVFGPAVALENQRPFDLQFVQ